MQRPPDLRTEPPREDFSKGDETHETAQACQRICSVRTDELKDESRAFWKALQHVHEEGRHASAVPSMPYARPGSIASATDHVGSVQRCPATRVSAATRSR